MKAIVQKREIGRAQQQVSPRTKYPVDFSEQSLCAGDVFDQLQARDQSEAIIRIEQWLSEIRHGSMKTQGKDPFYWFLVTTDAIHLVTHIAEDEHEFPNSATHIEDSGTRDGKDFASEPYLLSSLARSKRFQSQSNHLISLSCGHSRLDSLFCIQNGLACFRSAQLLRQRHLCRVKIS
jgi:hypothetical protein